MEEIEGPYLLNGLWHLFVRQGAPPAWFLPLASAWLVMLILVAVGALAGRRRQLKPGPLQNAVEMALAGLQGLSRQIAGPAAADFLPLFATLFLFILCSNLIGLIPGFASPTTNVNINAAMALIVALVSLGLGIRHKGLGGFLKHLCGPPYWLAPLFIIIRTLELFTRPLSLTMRLFGNMLAKEIMLGVLVYLITLFIFSSGVLIKCLVIVPLVLRPAIIVLGVLVAFIQALVFTALSMSYIGESLEQHH
jgi:F-type H+-transporting ATPase subunit a